MKIRKENLKSALKVAISECREQERKSGMTGDSGLVAGWVDVLRALERNEKVEIVD